MRLPVLLVALLLVATAAFVVGVSVERAQGETQAEAAPKAGELGHEEGAESGEEAPLVGLAMVAFAALDVREVIHQLDEDNEGLALLAGVVAALHLGVAAVALVIVRRPAESGRVRA